MGDPLHCIGCVSFCKGYHQYHMGTTHWVAAQTQECWSCWSWWLWLLAPEGALWGLTFHGILEEFRIQNSNPIFTFRQSPQSWHPTFPPLYDSLNNTNYIFSESFWQPLNWMILAWQIVLGKITKVLGLSILLCWISIAADDDSDASVRRGFDPGSRSKPLALLHHLLLLQALLHSLPTTLSQPFPYLLPPHCKVLY